MRVGLACCILAVWFVVGGLGGLRVRVGSGVGVVPLDVMCCVVGFGLYGLSNGRMGGGVEGGIVVWLVRVGAGGGGGVVILPSNGLLEGDNSVGGH